MEKAKAITVVTIFYLLMLCSRTCSFEMEYSNGKKFKYKLKGWYK